MIPNNVRDESKHQLRDEAGTSQADPECGINAIRLVERNPITLAAVICGDFRNVGDRIAQIADSDAYRQAISIGESDARPRHRER